MQQLTSTLRAADGLALHTIAWLPEAPPKAVVVIVHGIAEHSGRYTHVADHLVQRGYAVYSLDHRGHGQSEGTRAYFDHLDQPVADLRQYADLITATHPGVPLFVFGHSMGSLITLVFALRHQPMLAGVVSSGTPLSLASVPRALSSIVGLMSRVAPKVPLVKLDSRHISRDQAVASRYDSDPLNCRDPLRARVLVEMVAHSRAVLENAHAIRLPILILHGTGDKITQPGGSQRLYERIASPDKTLKFYNDLFHEICNEPEQEQVITDIADWLDAHIAVPRPS